MVAKYICIEGTEGVGKTTQTQKLVDHLKSKGYKVLQTKEPGTPLSPLTMALRNLMLNMEFDAEMTPAARELISQAIRSVHIEQVIIPALKNFDYIIQDRGILSGLAYGDACGNDVSWLDELATVVAEPLLAIQGKKDIAYLYDKVIYLSSSRTKEKLELAKTVKQEFAKGDAIEAKGSEFMAAVKDNMDDYSQWFNTVKIDVDDKSIDQVFEEIISQI